MKNLLPVIVMISCSYSENQDEHIQQVNTLFQKIMNTLRSIEMELLDCSIRVALMMIGTTPCWVKEMAALEGYSECEIKGPQEVANYQAALIELDRKLNRKEFMMHSGKIARPLILLITDDEKALINCGEQIGNLHNNGWFKHAQSYVCIIGNRKQDILEESVLHFTSWGQCIFYEDELVAELENIRPVTFGTPSSRKQILLCVDWEGKTWGTPEEAFPGFDEAEFI